MKQIFKSLVLVAAAVAALTSCEKAPETNPTPEEFTLTVNAVLPAPESGRTYLGDRDGDAYPVLWSEDDQIRISQVPYYTDDNTTFTGAANTKSNSSKSITRSADNTQATFMFDSFGSVDKYENDELTVEANFIDYIAIYGGDGYKISKRTDKNIALQLTLPASQKPAVGQFDPKAAIMGDAVLGEPEVLSSIDLNFKHLVAYAMLNVKGLNCGSEKVQSVTITSDKEIAGAANWNYVDGTSFTPRNSDAAVKSITVDLREQKNLTTDDFEVYFTAIPTDFVAGDKLTFVVTTDAKTYTKSVDVEAAFSLMQGKILDFSVNFAGVVADSSIQYDTYELVTDAATLAEAEGAEILIVAKNGEKYYAATTYNSKKVASIEVVVNADSSIRIASTDESFNRFRLESDNGFYMFFSLKDNKYIRYASSGTDLATTDISDKTDETNDYWERGRWKISISNGLATIENGQVPGRFFKMNNEGYFKAYGTGYITPSIYRKKVETNS